MASRDEWDDYFHQLLEPKRLKHFSTEVNQFIDKHVQDGRRVVLVTSGGTAVPLESNTVRFVDNFSSGTRGALSAEYFLQAGYAVIFLHRARSLEPFSRHWAHQSLLSLLELGPLTNGTGTACAQPSVIVKPDLVEKISCELQKHQKYCESSSYFSVPFTTLADYLFYLREFAKLLGKAKKSAMFYLAAAVSDFFLPETEMPEHKIQSSGGPLQLSLHQVPKMLSPLVKDWAPLAFIVSFKLETDEAIITEKARGALEKYSHQVVISNLLTTRRHKVTFVTLADSLDLTIPSDSQQELEELIVRELARRHASFVEADTR